MRTFTFLLILFFSTQIMAQAKQDKPSEKTALIIIDIQNFYFEGGFTELVNPDEASLNAAKLLKHFRESSQEIVHVQHMLGSEDPEYLRQEQIHDNVNPLKGEKVVHKNYPNGFQKTDLLEYLKSKEVTNLVICGMQTHMCVDATVRAAKDFGFNNIVVGDACATRDLKVNEEEISWDQVHKSFLAAFASYYAKVVTTENYLENK